MSWAGIEVVCRARADMVRDRALGMIQSGRYGRGFRLLRAARRLEIYASFALRKAREEMDANLTLEWLIAAAAVSAGASDD